MFNDLKLDDTIIKKNKIPILIKEKEWKSLFKDNMTKNMEKLSDKLNELIVEEKDALRTINILKKKKKALMETVLKLSDEVNTNNNSVALNKLEAIRNTILEVNNEIEDLQFKIEAIPKEIQKVNFELLKETVMEAYSDIKKDKVRVEYFDDEIRKLREKLGGMWEEKFTKEKKIDNLYNYLHGTLGHEEIDKLDKRFL